MDISIPLLLACFKFSEQSLRDSPPVIFFIGSFKSQGNNFI